MMVLAPAGLAQFLDQSHRLPLLSLQPLNDGGSQLLLISRLPQLDV